MWHVSAQQIGLIAAGALQLVTGVVAFLAPGAFYTAAAAYPPENHHFLRDIGTWNIGLGLVALLAQSRPSWHRPILAVVALQFALHTVSHVIDVGATDPESQSWLALVTFGLGTVVLAALALTAPSEKER